MRPADRDQALGAVRQFHAEYGRLPHQPEWERATPERPSTRTFVRYFGSWEGACRAAGRHASQALKGHS